MASGEGPFGPTHCSRANLRTALPPPPPEIITADLDVDDGQPITSHVGAGAVVRVWHFTQLVLAANGGDHQ